MITSKGRNGLKVMIDLAQHKDEGYISLTDIAQRVNESQKYLEAAMACLGAAGLVKSCRGKAGGYTLSKAPEDYSVWEILISSEGNLSPVSCLSSVIPCERADICLSLPLWRELDEVIENFLRSKTLSDLLK